MDSSATTPARPPEQTADDDPTGPRSTQETLLEQQVRLDSLLSERQDRRSWRRDMIDNLPVPALVTDHACHVLEANRAARELLGAGGDLRGRPLAEQVAAGERQRLLAAAATCAAVGAPQRLQVDVVDDAGHVTTVDLAMSPDEPDQDSPMLTWVVATATPGPQAGAAASALRAATALAEMCRLPLLSGADPRTVLARAALLVEHALPTCDGVSITLGAPSNPELQATDNRWAQQIDGQQLQAGEGPCLDAYDSGATVHCPDLAEDPRWPVLARLSADAGVRSVLGVPLRSDTHSLGVLNVYSRAGQAFDEQDRQVAGLLVTAVLAVVQEARDRQDLTQLSRQLREALDSRAVIDQAKGIVMAREGIDAEAAFARLVATSRAGNVKVRDVARLVVDSTAAGEPLPDTL